ncbi:MAG: HEAT repeat domain-containing protein [Bryobacteraceae bacterium]
MVEDEHRTNQELFQGSLQEDYDDEAAWDAVRALRGRGTEEVFQLAVQYCKSAVPLERARGLDVLAQIGAGAYKPESGRPHLDERLAIAVEHLHDENARVVSSAAWALSHIGGDAAISALIEVRNNSDSDVRKAVTCGMHGSQREDATCTLIELMDDLDDNVRDWATFGLGTQSDVDSPEIRDALRKRLGDGFKDARDEAIWGLAQRKDQQGLSMLIERLSAEHWIAGDETAAAETLNVPHDTPAEQLLDGLRQLLLDHFPR